MPGRVRQPDLYVEHGLRLLELARLVRVRLRARVRARVRVGQASDSSGG